MHTMRGLNLKKYSKLYFLFINVACLFVAVLDCLEIVSKRCSICNKVRRGESGV